MIVLTIPMVIILTCDVTVSEAQLDRLRKSKSLTAMPFVETPLVEVPAGEFMMGADGTQALEDERPSHRVWLDAFSIDLYEVTTTQYAAFLAATKRAAPWQWETVDLAQHANDHRYNVRETRAHCRNTLSS